MSISSSLAHKYDEFKEFPQQSAPKSAYEELKEWCEKWNIPHSLESNIRQGVRYICFKEGVVIIADGDIAFAFDVDDGKPL